MLEKVFKLQKNNTTVKTEFIAGLTTFLTMSYILALNPAILSVTGMDKGAIFVATAVAAIVGTLVMAFLANWPVGLAPGMGLNGFFAYNVVLAMGYSWQAALGAVFISGIIFLVLTFIGARQLITDAVPDTLKYAITAGLGLFLAIVALHNSGIVVKNDATLVGLGDITKIDPILTLLGFFLMTVLSIWNIRAAIFLGIVSITILNFFLNPNSWHNLLSTGLLSTPPSLSSTFLQLDIAGALHTGILHILLVFVLVEVLDATGSLIGIGMSAGLLKKGETKGLNKALLSDSCAILAGSLIGTSSTTAYAESASGIKEGGKTGLTAFFIALFFIIALFFSPIILAIPATATSAALLFVSCFMIKENAKINWDDISEYIPAVLAMTLMPLTYSIANGLAFGFISYAIIKSFTGKWREVKPACWVIAILFIARYIIE